MGVHSNPRFVQVIERSSKLAEIDELRTGSDVDYLVHRQTLGCVICGPYSQEHKQCCQRQCPVFWAELGRTGPSSARFGQALQIKMTWQRNKTGDRFISRLFTTRYSTLPE